MSTLASLMVSLGLKNEASSGVQSATSDFANLEDQVEQTGSAFDGLGSTMATAGKAAGLAAGGAVAVGLTEAISVDAANDKLAAQLGLTESESARIGDSAGRLYAGAYGDSLETVNQALRGVVQNVGGMASASSEQLEGVTASVLDVATAFEQDLGGVTKAVGQMMKTGMASSAEEALDIITIGFQQGVDKSEDFLDTINEYGTQFRKLGLDGATATGLLSQGLQAGARDADVVADAIKEFSIRAIDGSKATAEGFTAIGMSAEEMAGQIAAGGPKATEALTAVLDSLRAMEDPVARDAAAVALFGTQAEDLGEALFALDPAAAVNALGDVEGAASKMGDTLNDNAQTNLTSFWRQAKTAFVDLVGGKVLPIVNATASTLASTFGPALATIGDVIDSNVLPALKSFGSFIADNETPLMIVAGLIAAVFIPHLIALGVAATVNAAKVSIAWLVMKAGAISTAALHSATVVAMVAKWVFLGVQSLIQAARVAAAWLIAMGPIGWVIAAVIAIVALIIANWDTIKRVTTQVWNAVWKWVSDRVTDIANWVEGRINDVIGFFEWLGTLPGKVGAWFGSVKDAIVRKFQQAVDWVRGIPGKVLGALGDLGQLLWEAGSSIITGLLDGIKNAARKVWDFVSGIGSKIASLKGPLPYDRTLLIPAGLAIMDGLEGGLVDGFGGVMRFVRRMAPAIADEMGKTQLNPMGMAAQEVLDALSAGKKVFEDFSFKGMSDNLDRFNDKFADQWDPSKESDPRKWLQGVVSSNTANRVNDGGTKVTFDVDGADEDMKRLIRKMVRVDGGDVQKTFGR
ncbi:phage tail tape measure protein [Amycolatopsis palatopharyngis]|uniref:phage tail tape measure protein n=1 Tax=Amycolatopsis palatopharyngis TaxID=187982 RepID=UPI000E227FA9|nr:phage tail tape measure protein [Amycolatopsis palatopharyngis]